MLEVIEILGHRRQKMTRMLFFIPVIVFHARKSKLAWGTDGHNGFSFLRIRSFSIASVASPLACMMRARSITCTVVCDLDGGKNFYN